MAFTPSQHSLTGKAMGMSQASPTDARSMFFDSVNFVYRAYQNTAEVLSYLNLAKYRTGGFPILINTGGSLSVGVITGGINELYYFKDGVGDSDLVKILVISASQITEDSTHRFSTDTEKASWNGKADKVLFSTLASTSWNIGTQPYVFYSSSGSPSITISGGVSGQARAAMVFTKTGTGTLTINGNVYDTRDNGDTSISVVRKPDGSYFIESGYTIPGVAGNVAPVASSVSHTGTETEGQTLTSHYTYSDTDGDAEGSTLIKWYRSDDTSGTNKIAISGATSSTYVLQSTDVGKRIQVGITPVAATGTSPGIEVFSTYSGAIAAISSTITENFDSVTPPALPSGWTGTSGVVTSAFTGGTSPNILTTNDPSPQAFSYSTLRPVDTSISTSIKVNASTTAQLISYIRSSNLDVFAAGVSTYILAGDISGTGDFLIAKKVSGTYTILGTITGVFGALSRYRMTLGAVGTAITGEIFRISDSMYLTPGGTWQSGQINAFAVTDSSVSAAGYSGIGQYLTTGPTDSNVDDIQLN